MQRAPRHFYRGVPQPPPPPSPPGYIKAHVVKPGRTNPTTIGQLFTGKVHNSPPPPSVQQQETEQSQCSVILLWGTKDCQQSTRAGFCFSQRSVSSARDLVAVHIFIGVSVCSGSSPNRHSQKQTALLTATFTKRHFSQPPYKLYDIVFYYIRVSEQLQLHAPLARPESVHSQELPLY